jgi:hypothetical protein
MPHELNNELVYPSRTGWVDATRYTEVTEQGGDKLEDEYDEERSPTASKRTAPPVGEQTALRELGRFTS